MKHNRYYYCNPTLNRRQWFRPDEEEDTDLLKGAAKKIGKPKVRLLDLLWDAETFKTRLLDAKAHTIPNQEASDVSRFTHASLLAEMVKSNQEYMTAVRKTVSVPRTLLVTFDDCMRALGHRKVLSYDKEPRISFSYRTCAEAAYDFAVKDKRRVLCVVSDANGRTPAAGYNDGSSGIEEDLCRRIPNLYDALNEADRLDHLYAFGPSTYYDENGESSRYRDVLFTPDLLLARGSEEEGFPVLPADRAIKLSVVSASPPDTKKGELADVRLLSGTVTSMFVAPVLKQPLTTTLIIGAWGCGEYENNPQMIAQLFAQAIMGDLKELGTRLGKLYHEIHFAISPSIDSMDYGQIFRDTFRRYRMRFQEL